MTWINQNGSGSGQRSSSVPAPAPHEGLGAALRTAFLPRASDMPREIAELLDRLR